MLFISSDVFSSPKVAKIFFDVFCFLIEALSFLLYCLGVCDAYWVPSCVWCKVEVRFPLWRAHCLNTVVVKITFPTELLWLLCEKSVDCGSMGLFLDSSDSYSLIRVHSFPSLSEDIDMPQSPSCLKRTLLIALPLARIEKIVFHRVFTWRQALDFQKPLPMGYCWPLLYRCFSLEQSCGVSGCRALGQFVFLTTAGLPQISLWFPSAGQQSLCIWPSSSVL